MNICLIRFGIRYVFSNSGVENLPASESDYSYFSEEHSDGGSLSGEFSKISSMSSYYDHSFV